MLNKNLLLHFDTKLKNVFNGDSFIFYLAVRTIAKVKLIFPWRTVNFCYKWLPEKHSS